GGACCWGFDPQDLTACLIVPNRATCTEAQGFPNAVYRGDSTQCPQPPDDCNDGVYGACCFDDGLCLNTTSAFCNAPWVLADYQGDGTTCAGLDNACGFGACCLIDGTCAEVDAASACDALGGSFTAGATCAAAACPVAGACCENGACTEVIQDACSGGGQFFRGEGTACDDVDLPPCGPGACCIDATCTPVIDITICDVLGGSFFHDMTCADVDCQGPVIAIVSSDPPDGAIDARQPSEPDGSNPDGWSAITLTFDGDAGGVTAADFTITSDPPGAAPAIVDVVPVGNTATLTFDGSIPLVAWTVVTHDPSGTSVRIGYLPADVDNGGVSNANDVLTVIDNLNGVIEPLATYQCDVDRTDLCNASDVLREIDLLNGAATYDVWNGASLPN
ncbi:MAG: hypothetical protein ACE5E6_05855, partial [Phycisphaerae bacterium]